MKAPAPSIKSWDELEVVVPIEKVAQLYGKSTRAIERLVRLDRHAIPAPVLTRPMRWAKADLMRRLGPLEARHPKPSPTNVVTLGRRA